MLKHPKIIKRVNELEIEAKMLIGLLKVELDNMQNSDILDLNYDSKFMKMVDELKEINRKIGYCIEVDNF